MQDHKPRTRHKCVVSGEARLLYVLLWFCVLGGGGALGETEEARTNVTCRGAVHMPCSS